MLKRTFAALVPLLGLVACTTPTPVNPPPADAGVDAAVTTCDAPCASNERCVDGACAPADVLDLSVTEKVVHESSSSHSIEAVAWACGSLAAAAWTPDLPPPLAVEGACKVWSYEPGSIAPGPVVPPTEPGGVNVTTPTGMFPLPTMGTACATAKPTFELFAQSGVASFNGDGTGHFPAFHLEIAPAPPVQLAAGPVVRGQPLSLTWQAATSEGIAIDVYTIPKKGSTTTPPWIRCEVPDSGSYTIPASLTGLLDPESTFANVFGSRVTRAAFAPSDSPVVILAGVVRMDQLLLDYTP